jgi:glycosyltransferase involved in cell wall biosynthesis
VARATCDLAIRFDRNRGKGAALRAGIAEGLRCGAGAVVTIDADGQHDPSSAPALVAALADADMVIGARPRGAGTMPPARRLTNALAAIAVTAILGVRLPDTQSGFRAIRRAVLKRIEGRGDRYEYETDFLIRVALAGFRVASVPVPTIYGAPSHFRGVTDGGRVVRTIWRHRAEAFR